jgi:hypothetical protein
MATIKKPDANPIVALLLTLFVFNLGHLLINGQQKKWMMSLIVIIIGSFLLFFPGMILSILSAIDAMQTAERLQKGEEIGENEYTQPLLFKVVSIIDKTATCKTVTA